MGSVDFTTDHVQNSEAVIARKRSLIEVWSAHQKKNGQLRHRFDL